MSMMVSPLMYLSNLYITGFQHPSAIQREAIRPLLKGYDVIIRADSDIRKMAIFSISVLQIVDNTLKHCQALILVPTRELAQQIQSVIITLGRFLNIEVCLPSIISLIVQCHACIGGTVVRGDIRILQKGVHVVVGTPGRVLDMIRRQALHTDYIKIFVLNKADEMLSLVFKDQIYNIFQLLPRNTQAVMLSATMPSDLLEVTEKFLRNPVRIPVKTDELTFEGIKQFYIAVEKEDWKIDTLADLYETLPAAQAVIFCNTCRKVDWLADKLRQKDSTVGAVHGDMGQAKRDLTVTNFRSGESRLMIMTDRIARGIDVHVSLVVNYDLPCNRENYISRIACFGCKGYFSQHLVSFFLIFRVAITFVTAEDVRMMRDIEKFYSILIEEMPMNVADLI